LGYDAVAKEVELGSAGEAWGADDVTLESHHPADEVC
jgi:hypothetical protein